MSVNDRDVSALAHLATRLRQDTHGCCPWDLHGTTVVFAQHLKGKHLVTALELVLAHGQDPEAKTPAAVTRPFTPTELGTPIRPRCDKHPSQYADDCGQCEAEDRYAHAASDQTRDQALATMRAQVAGAQHAAHASTEEAIAAEAEQRYREMTGMDQPLEVRAARARQVVDKLHAAQAQEDTK